MTASGLQNTKGMEDNIISVPFSSGLLLFRHAEFSEPMDTTMDSLLHLRTLLILLFFRIYRDSVAPTPSTSRIFWSISFDTEYVLFTRLCLNARG